MTYRFIRDRCDYFTRSDGVTIVLLPKPYCERCADPIPPSYVGTGLCYNCYSGNTLVDLINLSKVYAASVYVSHSIGHILSDEIKKCKHDLSYTEGLAEVLEHATTVMYPELKSYDALTFPPRGSRTAKKNHLKEIVNSLSDRIEIEVMDILYKLTDYPSQQTLSRENRIENVKDKIGCSEYVTDRRVIVVDDVFTTGATLLNSAKALRKMGAKAVVGLVLGRAANIKHLEYTEVIEKVEDE